MKIEYRKGNLLDTDILVIAHGCNAQGVMGSGVALAIKQKYPEVFGEYVRIYQETGLVLGKIIPVVCREKTNINKPYTIIINAITQNFYGRDGARFVDYDAIRSAMKSINLFAAGQQVAMPKIGAGLGGGDWNIIEEIIEECFTETQPVVYEL